ncbi:hypothetical protein GCM10010400_54310 [Streptomyces aculeolatus]
MRRWERAVKVGTEVHPEQGDAVAGCCFAGTGGMTRLCTGGHAGLRRGFFALMPYRPRVVPAP